MRDAPIGPETKLTSFHRYTWWSLTGTTAFFLVVIVGEWILDADVYPRRRRF